MNILPLVYISRLASRDFLIIGDKDKIPLDSIIKLGMDHNKLEIWTECTIVSIEDEETIKAIGEFFARHCICAENDCDDDWRE